MTVSGLRPPPPHRAVLGRLRDGLDRLPRTARPQAWLLGICLLLFLPGLLAIQPVDPVETRTAVATRQLLEGGDLLQIRLGQAEIHEGPIGIHWLQAAVVRGLEALRLANRSGIPAYRLASLAGAILAVLGTYHWGRALVGRRAAFLGATMLAGSALLVAGAHLATADAPLLATLTAAMGLLGTAHSDPRRFTAAAAAGFWLLLAASLLLGGSAALLVPLLAGAALAVADRGAPWLPALRPGWGMPLMLGAALPWFVAIAATNGGEAIAALLRTDPAGRLAMAPQLPGRHLLAFVATGFPAAWILLLALPGLRQDPGAPAVRFLLAWAAPAWLLAELADPHAGAVLPAFPPLMLLGARWALDPARPRAPGWWLITAGLLLAGTAGAVGAGALRAVELDVRELPFAVLALAAAALLAWRLLVWGRAGHWARAALLGTLLAAPLYAAVLAGIFTHLPIGRIADRIAGTAQRVAPGLPAERFGVLGFDGASLLFAYGPEVHRLQDGAAAARFLAEAPGRVLAVVDMQEGAFRRAAAAQGIAVTEEITVPTFDPQRLEFMIFLFYRAAPRPG